MILNKTVINQDDVAPILSWNYIYIHVIYAQNINHNSIYPLCLKVLFTKHHLHKVNNKFLFTTWFKIMHTYLSFKFSKVFRNFIKNQIIISTRSRWLFILLIKLLKQVGVKFAQVDNVAQRVTFAQVTIFDGLNFFIFIFSINIIISYFMNLIFHCFFHYHSYY